MLGWVKRAVFVVVAVSAVAIVCGVLYEQLSRRDVASEHPPPGQLVDVGGHRLHLNCTGSGSPTVILEHGTGLTGSLSFVLVQPEIAKSHRVCSYDRAGIMWSEGGRKKSSVALFVDDLHSLLTNASESPPYIMVGYSFGGLLVREYTSRYPLEVQAMVLVESVHPEQNERFASVTGSEPYQYPRWTNLKERVLAEIGATRLFDSSELDDVPDEAMISKEFQSYSTVALQRELMSSYKYSLGAKEMSSLGDLPLLVLRGEWAFTSATPQELAEMTPEEIRTQEEEARIWRELNREWFEMQEELAALSTNSEVRVVEGAQHRISYEAPDAVVRAVNDVAEQILIAAQGAEPIA